MLEVKRRRNPQGIDEDIRKIQTAWFGKELHYRFGASVLIDEEKRTFLIELLENVAGNAPLSLTKASRDFARPRVRATREQHAGLKNLIVQIGAAECAGQDPAALKVTLDQLSPGG